MFQLFASHQAEELTDTGVVHYFICRFHPFYRPWMPLGRVKVCSTLFLDHGPRRGEGSASRPGRFLLPGKTRYPLYRRLGGPQGRSGQVRKISTPPGFDPRTAQSAASRYTDWATRTTTLLYKSLLFVVVKPVYGLPYQALWNVSILLNSLCYYYLKDNSSLNLRRMYEIGFYLCIFMQCFV
jgi:hypothetical protein